MSKLEWKKIDDKCMDGKGHTFRDLRNTKRPFIDKYENGSFKNNLILIEREHFQYIDEKLATIVFVCSPSQDKGRFVRAANLMGIPMIEFIIEACHKLADSLGVPRSEDD
jgi:hypothetical protein